MAAIASSSSTTIPSRCLPSCRSIQENFPAATDEEIDAAIATLDANNCDDGVDSASCETLIGTALALSAQYLQGLSGVYAQLDSENTLYVGGSDRVTAYGEVGTRQPCLGDRESNASGPEREPT